LQQHLANLRQIMALGAKSQVQLKYFMNILTDKDFLYKYLIFLLLIFAHLEDIFNLSRIFGSFCQSCQQIEPHFSQLPNLQIRWREI
jgi:hypothetical protein